jgi:hypothetical protein
MKKADYEYEDVYYILRGKNFHPSRLHVSGRVEITDANDPGDMTRIAKLRGKPTDYGACIVRCTISGRRKIAYLSRHLTKNISSYKAQHATHIVFWILWRGIQGNMELTVNELAKLAEMKVPVAMDYIYMET